MPSRRRTWGCIRMNKLTLTALACASALSACSLMPVYERPALPVVNQWPGIAAVSDRGIDSAKVNTDMGWRQFFVEETLQELISLALAHNRDLRIAVLNIEQTQAQLGIRNADRFPTVNAAGRHAMPC